MLKMESILRISYAVTGLHPTWYVSQHYSCIWECNAFFNGQWLVLWVISFELVLQAINKIKELAVSIEGKSLEEKKGLLAKCAATTLSSKLIGGEKDFFASMVVDAVIAIGYDDRLNLIGIKKVFLLVMRLSAS